MSHRLVTHGWLLSKALIFYDYHYFLGYRILPMDTKMCGRIVPQMRHTKKIEKKTTKTGKCFFFFEC